MVLEYRPAVVFRGLNPYYHPVKGTNETVYDFVFLSVYITERKQSRTKTYFFVLHNPFMPEDMEERSGWKYVLLVFDSYGVHVQFKTLNLLRMKIVIVLDLLTHSFHGL